MKNSFLIFCIVIMPSLSKAALTSYNMEVGFLNHTPPSFVETHVTASDFTGNNGYQGYTGGVSGNAVIDNGWLQSNQPTPANYFTFIMQADLGYELDLSGFTFDERRSAPEGMQWALRSSLDSFASDLGGGSASSAFTARNIAFTYNDITAPVEFRLYAYNAVNNVGDQWIVDNVSVVGTVAPVPEPSAALLFSAAVAGMAFRRMRSDGRPR